MGVGGVVLASRCIRPGALALAGVTVAAGLTGLAIVAATRSDHPWTQASEEASSAG